MLRKVQNGVDNLVISQPIIKFKQIDITGFALLMPEPNAGWYSPQLIWDRSQTADAP